MQLGYFMLTAASADVALRWLRVSRREAGHAEFRKTTPSSRVGAPS